MPVYNVSSPGNSCVQIQEHIAALLRGPSSNSCAAPAVDLVLIVVTVGNLSAKNFEHWPRAWIDINNKHEGRGLV